MRSWSLRRLCLPLALGASVMGLVGCAAQDQKDGRAAEIVDQGYLYGGGRTTVRAEPREEAPAPAPAPRRVTGDCSPVVGPNMNVSSMAFPTGDASSSAIMLHQVMPREVRAGANYESEIHVCNLTNGTLQNVVVGAENPMNMTMVSSTPAATRGTTGDMVWALGDLGAKETRVIKITGKADKVGQSGYCLEVSYNNLLCATTVVVEPALTLTKTADAEKSVCDTIQLCYEVKNTGTGMASNVRVKDTLPAGMTTVDGKSVVELDAGTLAAGQSKRACVTVKVAKGGNYCSPAMASADGGLTANAAQACTKVTQPVLTIDAECSGAALLNRPVTCKITVKNTGDGTAANTVVTAPISANSTFVSADNGGMQAGGNVTWNLGDLKAGETRTLTLTSRSTGAGDITCSASASATCAAQVMDSCKTTVSGTPDIGTLVTDDDGVVEVGNSHTYRVEVKNQGQVNLTNVKMVVALPAGMEFVSSADGKLVGGKVEFAFGTLGVGQTKAGSFVVRSTKSGELLVIGETTCAELKTPIRDDELTNFIDK